MGSLDGQGLDRWVYSIRGMFFHVMVFFQGNFGRKNPMSSSHRNHVFVGVKLFPLGLCIACPTVVWPLQRENQDEK